MVATARARAADGTATRVRVPLAWGGARSRTGEPSTERGRTEGAREHEYMLHRRGQRAVCVPAFDLSRRRRLRAVCGAWRCVNVFVDAEKVMLHTTAPAHTSERGFIHNRGPGQLWFAFSAALAIAA